MGRAPGRAEQGDRGELDELTLRRAQRGDEDACRALVVRYQSAVFALLQRMLGAGKRALVEDVAQETFLHVFRSLARFSPLGAARLSTWILTIASRRAIDELRRTGPVSVELSDDAPGPERTDLGARRRAIGAAIQQAVAELSPEYRAAFLLREYHELSYAEISHALGIAEGTVKSRLARARAALRSALAEVRDE